MPHRRAVPELGTRQLASEWPVHAAAAGARAASAHRPCDHTQGLSLPSTPCGSLGPPLHRRPVLKPGGRALPGPPGASVRSRPGHVTPVAFPIFGARLGGVLPRGSSISGARARSSARRPSRLVSFDRAATKQGRELASPLFQQKKRSTLPAAGGEHARTMRLVALLLLVCAAARAAAVVTDGKIELRAD